MEHRRVAPLNRWGGHIWLVAGLLTWAASAVAQEPQFLPPPAAKEPAFLPPPNPSTENGKQGEKKKDEKDKKDEKEGNDGNGKEKAEEPAWYSIHGQATVVSQGNWPFR